MPPAEPLEIMLAHNLWATRKLLDACDRLSEEQFHRRFEMGPGSLHDTATHIIAGMRRWGDLLAGREQRPRLEGPRRSVADLAALLEEIGADVAASARAHPVSETVTAERGGRTASFTRGAVLTHVLTHGMHHRAQCLNMLRQLGAEPLPPSSVLEWLVKGA